jgi:hypothetical protein
MKFQFSLARLLMATTMVAVVFGLARLMLNEEISSFVVLIAVLAGDLGLLVLIAQKKSDLYRILSTITVILAGFSIVAALLLIGGPDSSRIFWLLVMLPLIILFFLLLSFINRKIEKMEKEESKLDDELSNDPSGPREP